jgi:hypothetical protein
VRSEAADDVGERSRALVEVVPDDGAWRAREEHGERLGDAIGRRRRARLADGLGGSLDGVARVSGAGEWHVDERRDLVVARGLATSSEHERGLPDAGRPVHGNDATARDERAKLRELSPTPDHSNAADLVQDAWRVAVDGGGAREIVAATSTGRAENHEHWGVITATEPRHGQRAERRSALHAVTSRRVSLPFTRLRRRGW